MAKSLYPKKHLALVIVAACFFIIDRILKNLALTNFKTTILPGLINFQLAFNSRLALSLGPINSLFILIIILIIILIVLVFFILSLIKKSFIINAALMFILLGAISNILDRLTFGQVIDYFNIPLTVFNLADLSIITGTIILISALNFNKN